MRGEVFVGSAGFLSFAALLLLIFVHVGQINTSTVPRGIYMARVNFTGYQEALEQALFVPIEGLTTSNASAPLREERGLRQFYEFGLYSHCGYVNDTAGICSNTTFANRFRPYEYITEDMIANYTSITDSIIFDTTFRDSGYLGQSSRAAFWMIFLATIGSAVALVLGMVRHGYTFFFSTLFAGLSSLFVLIGAAIWTVLIQKSQTVADILIGTTENPVPIGVEVSTGTALYMLWAAFACSFVSLVPYLVVCCTYRG